MGLIKPKTGGTLPSLSNPASAEQIKAGYQVIGSNGQVITGTMEEETNMSFIATFNETTYDEVVENIAAGKMIFCKYHYAGIYWHYYPMVQYKDTMPVLFGRVGIVNNTSGSTAIAEMNDYIVLNTDGTWSHKTTSLHNFTNISIEDLTVQFKEDGTMYVDLS